jgi:pyrroline-5-carboxylate reductase
MHAANAPHDPPRMETPPHRLAVIGFGRLASALVRGCLATGFLRAQDIVVWARSDRRADEARSLGLATATLGACAAGGRTLLLAVKPQSFESLLPGIALRPGTAAISVMAGWSCDRLAQTLGVAQVIRAMPNVAAEVRAAVTALAVPSRCTAEERDFAVRLFESVGRVERLAEAHLDAATAIASSGLAYLCLFVEALERAAARLGLPEEVAKSLSLDVLHGVAASVAGGRVDPAALRASVTSPNGTTAAALAVLEAGEFTQLIEHAAQAARDRAAELGRAGA